MSIVKLPKILDRTRGVLLAAAHLDKADHGIAGVVHDIGLLLGLPAATPLRSTVCEGGLRAQARLRIAWPATMIPTIAIGRGAPPCLKPPCLKPPCLKPPWLNLRSVCLSPPSSC